MKKQPVNNNYLFKLILSYVVLTLLILGMFGGYMVKKASDLYSRELIRENENQLEKLRSFVEDNYLAKFQASILNKAMTTIRSDSSEDIGFFLDHPKDNNYFRIYKMNSDLKTLTMSMPGMDNVILYFPHSDFAVDQHYFYNTMDRSPDAELLQQLSDIPPHQWFSRTTLDGVERDSGRTKKVLTYIYTLPFKSSGNQVKGYMILDVSLADLTSKLNEFISHSGEYFYIFSQDGSLITSNAEAPKVTGTLASLEQMRKQGSSALNLGSGEWLSVMSPHNSALDWTYVTRRSGGTLSLLSQTLLDQVWLAILITLLIGLCISFMLSVRLHQPFKNIMIYLNVLKKDAETKHIQDLLIGRLSEETNELPLDPDGAFVVAVIKAEGTDPTWLGKQFQQKSHLLPGLAVFSDRQQIAVIYSANSEHTENAVRSAMEDIGRFRRKLNVKQPLAAGVGSAVTGTDQIHASYSEALEALEYTFIHGDRAIIAYEETAAKNAHVLEMPELEVFENIIRSADKKQISEFFQEIKKQLYANPYKLDSIRLLLDQLALSITKVILQKGYNSPKMVPNDIIQTYRQKTLDATSDFLEQLCLNLSDWLSQQAGTPHSEVAHSMKEYMDTRIHQDLSLDEIAERFSYSKQFICKVFKEHYNLTITEYLTDRRIEAAKELLTGSSSPIAEIAEQTGFRSTAYFCTKFKQMCGVTPAQYRTSSARMVKSTVNP